ncbi:MAG: hypothetical protein QY310_12525 [Candidatus Jettenia sp. CY-1]|nr:MAG: hypothetical protein QY310_12525 [Candidatus Jettenia sp. CY-1]
MGKPLRILMVEDSLDDAEPLLRELRIGGYDLIYKWVETDLDMKKALEQQEWDIVLPDHSMPRFSSLGALNSRRQKKDGSASRQRLSCARGKSSFGL